MVQGDIFSPMCFIIALALIMERHGVPSEQLGPFGLIMDHLDYADDMALCDRSVEDATERVSRIARALRVHRDLSVATEHHAHNLGLALAAYGVSMCC